LDEKTLNQLTDQVRGQYDLIILDTLGTLLPPPRSNGDAYQRAIEQLKPFHTWCDRLKIHAIVIHHTKRAESGDNSESHDDISGGRGYAAVADTIVTFKRDTKKGANDFKVSVTGRVAEEAQWHLGRDGARWVLHGLWESGSVTNERKAIIDAMRSLGGSGTAKTISPLVGKPEGTVYKNLQRMEKAKLLRKVDRGVFEVVDDPVRDWQA